MWDKWLIRFPCVTHGTGNWIVSPCVKCGKFCYYKSKYVGSLPAVYYSSAMNLSWGREIPNWNDIWSLYSSLTSQFYVWFSYLSDCNARDQNFMGGFHIFKFNAQLFWTYTRCTNYLLSCLTGVFVFLHVFLPATILRMHAARQYHSCPCQTAIESNFDGLQGFQPSKFLIVHSIILYVKNWMVGRLLCSNLHSRRSRT